MECISCSSIMKKSREQYHYIESGLSRVYLDGIEIFRCSCGEELVEISNMEELHELLALKISSQQNRLPPASIRFLRTYLGFSGVDFARKMGIKPETVSRWEKGSLNMSETSERLLRLLVLTQKGPFRNYDDLEYFGSLQARVECKRVFKRKNSHWVEQKVA